MGMKDLLVKHIKTNIAQFTQLFNIEQQNVTAQTESNKIHIQTSGEWTISGGGEGVATSSCLNGTYTFENNEVTTDCYFGDPHDHQVVIQKVNVGSAVSRDAALQIMTDTKTENAIIVYLDTSKGSTKGSSDYTTSIHYTLGVMYRIETEQLQELGCEEMDAVFVNSCLGVKACDTTKLSFGGVTARFKAGKHTVFDYQFSYVKTLEINDIIKERLRGFDATLNIKQGVKHG